MAWRLPSDKPLSEAMMVSVLTHICVTRSQWVNLIGWSQNSRCAGCPPSSYPFTISDEVHADPVFMLLLVCCKYIILQQQNVFRSTSDAISITVPISIIFLHAADRSGRYDWCMSWRIGKSTKRIDKHNDWNNSLYLVYNEFVGPSPTITKVI